MHANAAHEQSSATSTSAEHVAPEAEHEHAAMSSLSAGLTAGGGAPLPGDTRQFMEDRIGADFSSVRVHTDSALADGIDAQAFTHGNDIHFGAGRYAPNTPDGKHLLAHELTHVVQQGGQTATGPQAKGPLLNGSPALEAEADRTADTVMAGGTASVTGAGTGVMRKNKALDKFTGLFSSDGANRSFLDGVKATEPPRVAAEQLAALQARLTNRAELTITGRADLVKHVEDAAAAEVARIGHDKASSAKGGADVEAIAAKIAKRSGAAKTAFHNKADEVAKEIAKAGSAYEQAFKAAAAAAIDKVRVTRTVVSQAAIIAEAKRAAASAAAGIASAEYEKAKAALLLKFQDPAFITELKTDMASDAESGVETRAEAAVATRDSRDAKLGQIAEAARKPFLEKLDHEVEAYLAHGLGADGAPWYRGAEVKAFRADMKKAARTQAKEDANDVIDNGGPLKNSKGKELGGATKRYVRGEAHIEAYDKAKESVNLRLHEVAKTGTVDVLTQRGVDGDLTDAARQAAFAVYEDKGHEAAAKTAANAGAKAKYDAIRAGVLATAKEWKDSITKAAAHPNVAPSVDRAQVKDEVVEQVKDDEVGKQSVEAAIKANDAEDGLGKVGKFLDFLVPERGDAVKFKISLEFPTGYGSVFVELQGDAERGTRERILKKDPNTGKKEALRDTSSLKLQNEVRIGYGGSLPGVKMVGTLGFFLRSDAASTDQCLKGLSYGIYRFLSGACAPLANLWAGNGKKAEAMAQIDPSHDDLDRMDPVYRAELWAAMVEEQVFNADKDARVDIGGSANFNAELNADLIKAKGGIRAEVMRSYTKKYLKRGATPGTTNKLGDDTFDKQGAHDRRKAISGKTTGAIYIDTEVEAGIKDLGAVFGGKFKYVHPDGFELEVSGGLKFSSSDEANATRDAVKHVTGIVSGCANVVHSIAGICRGKALDGEEGAAGSLGNAADLLTRTFTNVNDALKNSVGQAMSEAAKVPTVTADMVNEGAATAFKSASGKAAETTKALLGSENVYKVSIVIGSGPKLMVKIDEVQTKKLGFGGGSTFGLNVEYEKSRRMAQIGMSDGRFHGELMGISTKT